MRSSRLHLSTSLIFLLSTAVGCTTAATTEEEPSSVEQAIRCNNPDGCPIGGGCSRATGSLWAGNASVPQGGSTTLSWSAVMPLGCGEQLLLNGLPVAESGSMTVSPLSTSGYVLRAGPKELARARVEVVLDDVVYIDGSTPVWAALLVQAVGTPPRAGVASRRVVIGANVDMDLTGFEHIQIVDNVTLTSEKPPPPTQKPPPKGKDGKIPRSAWGPQPPLRDAQHLGPRLFTTSRPEALFDVCSRPPGEPPIIDYHSNNIHILGFRIDGADHGTSEGSLTRGLRLESCLGTEVGDMEISGFAGSGIQVNDGFGRQLVGGDTVNIHDSFFHHNQHGGGDGYGVDVGPGAFATIQRSVFDFNRHAISSSGHIGTGYIADHNLILKGGGYQDRFLNTWTHLMDVHGDADCWNHTAHSLLCGNAGEQFFMTNNAFQYTNDNAIKIRGTPTLAANIYGNVFPHYSESGAIANTQGPTNIYVGANTYRTDTFGEYGVCDFDGDGKDDLFLATGASWWLMSAGKMHWTFMSPRTERLSDVRLGDFNGDRRCDVIAKNTNTNLLEISSGGTGVWTVLPGNLNDPLEKIRTGDFNGDGKTDIFFRGDDGQWWAISPGIYGWTALQNSPTPLAELKFGDFDNDGYTDVLARPNGKWAISWRGLSTWDPAGSSPLSDDITNMYIANVDGLPGDDVVQYVVTAPNVGNWQISSGARNGWSSLAWQVFTAFPGSTDPCLNAPASCARTFVGKFDDFSNADILMLDKNARTTQIYSPGHADWSPHGVFAY